MAQEKEMSFLAHLEELRQRYNALISKDAATQRLQRIYRVVKQA